MHKTDAMLKIEGQIEKLQQRAVALREKEKAGVASRIKEAIDYYGFTPQDLFEQSTVARPARAKKVDKRRRPSPQAGMKAPIKFRDEEGNEWSGRGSQPRWLKAALKSGKTIDDFAVKSE